MDKLINTEVIKNYMLKYNLSKTAFSRQCKIGTDTLQKILEERQDLRLQVLRKLSNVMKISIKELLYRIK